MTDQTKDDPTDYKAEFYKLRNEVHRYRDFLVKAEMDAEAILRPYLKSAAIFGITPSSEFREMAMLPSKLRDAIAGALAASRGGLERADKLLGGGERTPEKEG